ncbi:MAG: hypothetical protein ACAH88_15070 [Roseimicrobium sp.]
MARTTRRRIFFWLMVVTCVTALAGLTYFVFQWTSQEPLSIRIVKVTRAIDDSQRVHYEITNDSAFPVYFVADHGLRGLSRRAGEYSAHSDLTATQGMEVPTPLPPGGSFTVVAFADKQTRFQDYDCYYRYEWAPTSQRYLHGFRVWAVRHLHRKIVNYIPSFEGSRDVETGFLQIASPEKGFASWSGGSGMR